MALIADSSAFALGTNTWLAKAQRFIGSMFQPARFSPEASLLSTPLCDARLAPRAAMSHEEIDVGTLSQLSMIGLKRAKLVTEHTHPELTKAWAGMAKRAGITHVPQLMIAESDSLNAITIGKGDEIVITTGLLKVLDLRQTVAVLGHELGHAVSDHHSPRVAATGAAMALGAIAGNEFGRWGGIQKALSKLGEKLPFVETIRSWVYRAPFVDRMSSVLGTVLYMGMAVGVGRVIANQFTVRPTELDADKKGATISGDPHGLAQALGILQQHMPPDSFKLRMAKLSSGYPSIQKRIDHLQRIASEQPTLQPMLSALGISLAPVAPANASPLMQAATAPAVMAASLPQRAVSGVVNEQRVTATESPAIA